MDLATLLEEAEQAPPDQRILWRDRIAGYGARAIGGVRPWLSSPTLAAFAIRVIERVGTQGEAELAASVLRAERSHVPAHIAGDVNWALQRLRPAGQPLGQSPPERTQALPAPPPRRDRPHLSPVVRRRTR